jgi:hypothetical protein
MVANVDVDNAEDDNARHHNEAHSEFKVISHGEAEVDPVSAK